MKKESLSEKIKLPSSWMLVNAESIWKHLVVVSKTGTVFNKEQLVKAGLYTSNDDNISRNLSYLKYLAIIDEERGKGKDQRFRVIENPIVKDIVYELRAGREENAKIKFKAHLERHILFETLKNEFFAGENTKTLNDLEHFLKDGIPNKSPQYYQKGGEFLIRLLNIASLAELQGNEIILLGNNSDSTFEENQEDSGLIISEERADEITIQSAVQLRPTYNVKIQSPNINLEINIRSHSHLALVRSLLETIQQELDNEL